MNLGIGATKGSFPKRNGEIYNAEGQIPIFEELWLFDFTDFFDQLGFFARCPF